MNLKVKDVYLTQFQNSELDKTKHLPETRKKNKNLKTNIHNKKARERRILNHSIHHLVS